MNYILGERYPSEKEMTHQLRLRVQIEWLEEPVILRR